MKLYDILMSENIEESIYDNLDYLLEIIPELKYTIGFDQKHPHHIYDVFDHTMCALSLSPEDYEIRLALLFHDISKPFCNQEKDGILHYKGHQLFSANMAVNILTRLNFDDELIYKIWILIKLHDFPIHLKSIIDYPELSRKLYMIQYCDAHAHNPKYMDKRIDYLDKTKKLFK